MTQEPLYPEGHPKRIEQDSQRTNVDATSSSKKKKKNNDRTLQASSEPVVDTPENPNDISISDAETQSGNDHEPSDCRRSVNGGAQTCLPAACGVAQVVAQCGPSSSTQAQDPREGPGLAGWTTGSFLRHGSG